MLGDIKNIYLRRSAIIVSIPFVFTIAILGGAILGAIDICQALVKPVQHAWKGSR